MQELSLHKRSVADVDWSPDNLLLASAAEDGGVCLWQVDGGQLVRFSIVSWFLLRLFYLVLAPKVMLQV